MFLAGAGAVMGPIVDGGMGVPGQGRPALPIRVTVGGGDGEVMYAGSLTGTANGVVQLNVKLPPLDVPATAPVPVIVAVGDAATVAAIYLCNCGH